MNNNNNKYGTETENAPLVQPVTEGDDVLDRKRVETDFDPSFEENPVLSEGKSDHFYDHNSVFKTGEDINQKNHKFSALESSESKADEASSSNGGGAHVIAVSETSSPVKSPEIDPPQSITINTLGASDSSPLLVSNNTKPVGLKIKGVSFGGQPEGVNTKDVN